MDAGFKVKIGGDTSELTKSFAVANEAIRGLSVNIVNLTNVLKQGFKIDTSAIVKSSNEGQRALGGLAEKAVSTGIKLGGISTKTIQVNTDTSQLEALITKADQAKASLAGIASKDIKFTVATQLAPVNLASLIANTEAAKNVFTDLRNEVRSTGSDLNNVLGKGINVSGIVNSSNQGADALNHLSDSAKTAQTNLQNVTGKNISFSIVSDNKVNLAPIIKDTEVARQTFTNLREEIKNTGLEVSKIGGTRTVKVDVDAKGLVVGTDGILRFNKSTDDLTAQLKRFQALLKTATNPESILRLNNAIAATKERINSINNLKGFDNFNKTATSTAATLQKNREGAEKAGFALTNLGRVASDLPFGFVSIQNNLNPLLESFQSLNKVAKDTGQSSFKLLLSSLTGAGGLGFALSAVSAAITLATMGMGAWTRGLSGSGKAGADAAKAIDKYNESLKSIDENARNSAQAEIAHVRVLQSIASDVTATYANRGRAIDELQKKYPAYLGNIERENFLNGQAKSAIDAVTQALLNRAAAQAAEKKFAAASEKVYDLTLAQEGATKKAADAQTAFEKKFKDAYSNSATASKEFTATYVENYRHQAVEAKTSLDAVNKELAKAKGEQARYLADAQKFARDAGALFFDNDQEKKISVKAPKLKDAKDIKGIADYLEELRKELKAIDAEESIGLIAPKEADIDRTRAFKKAIEEIIKLPNVTTDTPIIKQLTFELNPIDARTRLDKAIDTEVRTVERDLSTGPLNIVLPVNPTLKVNTKPFQKELSQSIIEATNGINSILQNTISQVFVSVGESIGSALVGQGGLGDAFKSLWTVLGNGIRQLGEYLISISPLVKAIKASLNALEGPGLLIAGVGLVAIGSAIARTLPKFAEGTMTTGPMIAQIGDNFGGREYVTPSQSIGRLAAEITANMGGSGGPMQVFGRIEAEGDKLVTIIDRAVRKRGRIM